jgi:hypothetical protein
MDDMFDSSGVNVSQDRLERGQVRVRVSDDGNALVWWNIEHSWHGFNILFQPNTNT